LQNRSTADFKRAELPKRSIHKYEFHAAPFFDGYILTEYASGQWGGGSIE